MHVAITGASSGIGEALARAWAKKGARVTIIARRKALLEKLAAELGENARVLARDLSDPSGATEWIADAEAAHGPIDLLVNNAGMENVGLTAASDVETGLRLLQLNLVTPILLTRAMLPAMLARKSGTIVQIASVAGLAAPPGQAWYGASKAGLAQFTETLRVELRGTGVHVCVVYPGPIKTAMGDSAFAKYGGREAVGTAPEGTPEELARRVVRAVERRHARVIYPGFYRAAWYLPWLARIVTFRMAPMPK